MILGNVDIFIRSGHRVHPYFNIPMPRPPDGWQKVWFFLRNDADVPLHMFMGSCPAPNPTGATVW
jgi:hypothetical protein